MKAKCIKGVKEGDECNTNDAVATKEVEIKEGEIYEIIGGIDIPNVGHAVFLKDKPESVAYNIDSFEPLPDETHSPDLDNMPLLTVNEVYRFMIDSGAYLPYNRPTFEMLRSIAKSKLRIYR